MKTKRRTVVGIALLAILLGVAACSGSQDSSSARDAAAIGEYPAAPSTAAAASSAAAAGPAAADSAGGGAAAPEAAAGATASAGAPAEINVALQGRQVIKTATVQVELTIPIDTPSEQVADVKRDAVAGATANLSAQTAVLGGFVGNLDQSGAGATIILRVPTDKYDALLKAVGNVGGEITNVVEAAQDVTAQVTDIASRIKSQQTSVERIRALLSEATNLEDIIRLESELSSREADLESLQGQLAVLSDQVALSTISVSFTAIKDYVPSERPAEASGFAGGLASGWDAFTNLLGGLAVLVGTLLPFVPIFALIIFGLWLLRRRVRSRRLVTAGPAIATGSFQTPGAFRTAGAAPADGHYSSAPFVGFPGRPAAGSAAPQTGTTPPIPPTQTGTAESSS